MVRQFSTGTDTGDVDDSTRRGGPVLRRGTWIIGWVGMLWRANADMSLKVPRLGAVGASGIGAGRTRVVLLALALVVVAGTPLLLSLPFLGEPMEQDEGVYFSMALSGNLPYLEVFDHKPPVIYGWYALSLVLTGGDPSIEAIRVLAALQLSAMALAVVWVGSLTGGWRLGLTAGLLAAVSTSNQFLQFNANTETFMLFPMVLALGSFLVGLRRRNAAWFVLSGALIALATLTKTVGALNFAALLGVLLWSGAMGQVSWEAVRRWSLSLTAGAGFVVALAVTPFVVSGHFSEFWYANVTYNISYSNLVSPLAKVYGLAQVNMHVIAGGLFLWVMAGVGAILLLEKVPRTEHAALLASVAAVYLGASLTGQEYPHYWVPMVPFAALLAGFAVTRVTESWGSLRHRLHVELLFSTLALATFIAVLPLYLADADEAHLMKYDNGVNAQHAIDNEAVAAHVASITEAGDRIFNLGRDAQLYVLSDRRPASYFTRPLAAAIVDPSTFDETLEALRADPPELIVDTSYVDLEELGQPNYTGGGYNMDAGQRLRFELFLAESYILSDKVGHAVIYILEPSTTSGHRSE